MTSGYSLSLAGKNAVISGSSRGVGFAIASALAAAGANVAINYLSNEERGVTALAALREINPSAISVKADVSAEEGADMLISEAENAFGGVDILVNNAHGRIIRNMFPEVCLGRAPGPYRQHPAPRVLLVQAGNRQDEVARLGQDSKYREQHAPAAHKRLQRPHFGYGVALWASQGIWPLKRDRGGLQSTWFRPALS